MLKIAVNSGWWYPFQNIVFVCDKPVNINYDQENKIMNDTEKPIFKFADGYKMYCINNIRIPSWVFETEKEKIDCQKIIALENVEQKKEIIQFLGEDCFFNKIDAKCIDKQYLYLDQEKKVYTKCIHNSMQIEYKLLVADIGLSEPLKLLCMDNASNNGVKHYETVEPKCETVLDAFESRTGIREFPVYLS